MRRVVRAVGGWRREGPARGREKGGEVRRGREDRRVAREGPAAAVDDVLRVLVLSVCVGFSSSDSVVSCSCSWSARRRREVELVSLRFRLREREMARVAAGLRERRPAIG